MKELDRRCQGSAGSDPFVCVWVCGCVGVYGEAEGRRSVLKMYHSN